MAYLNITLIDVGWGDSIFLEHCDSNDNMHYALIDSNDNKNIKSTQIFIERLFNLKKQVVPTKLFDFVVLSHWHSDHLMGLESLLRKYGAENFWHPKSNKLDPSASLLRYCGRANSKVDHYEAVDETKIFNVWGDVSIKILWPHRNVISKNENNNSIVLVLEYQDKSVILTGDAEEEVWEKISSQIPSDTAFFKVPHHGSRNGSLDNNGNSTWLNTCPHNTKLGISCMYRRDYKHPHSEVLDEFQNSNFDFYRTDEHYHLTFSIDDAGNTSMKYSHI